MHMYACLCKCDASHTCYLTTLPGSLLRKKPCQRIDRIDRIDRVRLHIHRYICFYSNKEICTHVYVYSCAHLHICGCSHPSFLQWQDIFAHLFMIEIRGSDLFFMSFRAFASNSPHGTAKAKILLTKSWSISTRLSFIVSDTIRLD